MNALIKVTYTKRFTAGYKTGLTAKVELTIDREVFGLYQNGMQWSDVLTYDTWIMENVKFSEL